MTEMERFMLNWVKQGFSKAAGLVFFYGFSLFILMSSRFYRHSRTHFYFGYLFFCTGLLMLSYYVWAFDGMTMYYYNIRH